MPVADDVVALIDRAELIEFALEISNIDSAVPNEAAVAEHVYQWLVRQGFATRKVGLLRDRFNVMGVLPGSGGGFSLLFNSHLDTFVPAHADLVHRDPGNPMYHRAWQEGDLLVGEGIANDKGPMAAFLIAANAIRKSGHKLKGDVVLTCVIAETSREPCDEPPGAMPESKELGARFLATHGGVADYALVAEGTGFGMAWVEAGKFWYKIVLNSSEPPYYTPYLPERTTIAKSPNMIVAAGAAIKVLEKWAALYQTRNVYRSSGGTIVPKAQIGAIRGGDLNRPTRAPQLCELYLDVRSVPSQDPLRTRDDISRVLREAGLNADVTLYHFRPGYEAKNIDRLVDAVGRAHRATFREEPKPPQIETSSMWRDLNVFNELGIPALTYGPRGAGHSHLRALSADVLYQAACAYARIAVELCNEEKPPLPES
jgi:acetylornithine deacetylase/succinyl-diaminopimelate desuccinylase-like protein